MSSLPHPDTVAIWKIAESDVKPKSNKFTVFFRTPISRYSEMQWSWQDNDMNRRNIHSTFSFMYTMSSSTFRLLNLKICLHYCKMILCHWKIELNMAFILSPLDLNVKLYFLKYNNDKKKCLPSDYFYS